MPLKLMSVHLKAMIVLLCLNVDFLAYASLPNHVVCLNLSIIFHCLPRFLEIYSMINKLSAVFQSIILVVQNTRNTIFDILYK